MLKKLTSFLLALIPFCAHAQRMWTEPKEFTPTDAITIYIDNANDPILKELDEAWLWAWIPDVGDAPSNLDPASAANEIARFAKNSKGVWKITIVPTNFFKVPAEKITEIGFLLKGRSWSNGKTPNFELRLKSLPTSSTSQDASSLDYRAIAYNSDKGLPNDLVKAIHADSMGFVWVATDNGISRFDGKSFLNVIDSLPSAYVKYFSQSPNGALLASTDLGIIQIHNHTASIGISDVIKGSREQPNTHEVRYPKNIHVSSKGVTWIAEPEAIVKHENGKLKRYLFDEKARSFDFLRSFSFVETSNGELWVFGFTGHIFKYDPNADLFKEVAYKNTILAISGAIEVEPGVIWITSGYGLMEIRHKNGSILDSKMLFSDYLASLSCIVKQGQKIYIGSWNRGMHEVSYSSNGKHSIKKIVEYPHGNASCIYVMPSGEVWVGSNHGIVLLFKTFFQAIENEQSYVHDICEYNGRILVADSKGVFEYSNASAPIPFFESNDASTLSLTSLGSQIAITTSSASAYIFPNASAKEPKRLVLKRFGDAIFNSLYTKDGSLWLIQDNFKGIHRYYRDSLMQYQTAQGINTDVYSIYESAIDGGIYVGGARDAYLLKFNAKANRFENISKRFADVPPIELRVNDLVQAPDGTFFFATNEGVFYERNDQLQRYPLEQYNKGNIKSIALGHEGTILYFASDLGLVRVPLGAKERPILLNTSSGLPNKTTSYRSIFIDSNKQLWVGTTAGVAVAPSNSELVPTAMPIFYMAKINGESLLEGQQVRVKGNALFEVSFTSIAYPAHDIIYRYRLVGADSTWKEGPSPGTLYMPNLSPGFYTFEVQALQQNNKSWSPIKAISFTIGQPWYLSIWSVIGGAFALMFLITGIVRLNTRRLEKEKLRLEGLVQERTSEVVKQKEEIQMQAEELAAQRDSLASSYENVRLLSEIGKEITSVLSVEEIVDTTHQQVNQLMEADGFGIGLFNEKLNRIEFPRFIEKGMALPFFFDELGDHDSISDYCFTYKKDILINDFAVEARQYVATDAASVKAGSMPSSMIYVPLLIKGKAIGNLTVQSFKKNAYTGYHINIVKNMAIYVAIALENADAYRRIEEEQNKSESLLLNILPAQTAQELKEYGKASPMYYDKVSVLFADVKGFTKIAEQLSPQELLDELDDCFLAFDEICDKHGLERIKTIGDAYMAAGGVPVANQTNPIDAVTAALEMQAFMSRFNQERQANHQPTWEIRIGVHTGSVVAGVVGKKKFAYDIWGDAVNVAARMEQHGEIGKVNISGSTYALVQSRISCSYRGKINAKNKGEVDMYWAEQLR